MSLRLTIPSLSGGGARRGGMTLVELITASAISTLVAVGLVSLSVAAGRLAKSVSYQNRAVQEGKTAIEGINREIRMATTPLQVVDAGGNPSQRGNRITFHRLGEAPNQREIKLASVDGDIMTPWDNRLILDPNTAAGGDEIVLAQWMTPLDAQGAFHYEGVNAPLQVQMRCGDSLGAGMETVNNARSGPGNQGMEINIRVAPRN